MKTIKYILFLILSFTWGLPMSLIGAFVAIVLICAGYKPQIFHGYIYFIVGNNWGGVNFGCFFVISKSSSLHTKQHEAGHGIQNIIFGWLMPFVVSIPSMIRYWYREFEIRKGQGATLPAYDSIWFEGWATKLGEKYFAEDE